MAAAVTAAPSSLTLTVLGCSGSFPGPGSACSGYLVRGSSTTLWLDAGSGTMSNLQHHVGLDQVDAVVLSHEHPDHWSDVEGFRVALAYAVERSGVPVYAPEGVRRLLSTDPEPTFDWHVVSDGDEVETGGLRLRFSRTDHPPETLAVRIDGEGRCLGYSADTGRGWSFEALGAGIDLALCEATYVGESDVPGHLTATEAARMAADCGVGRLVLTHLFPGVDRERARHEAEAAYGGPVDVARMHEEYEV